MSAVKRASWLVWGVVLALVLGVSSVHAQGPFAAQIEAFWQVISTGGRAFSNLDITSSGYISFGTTLGTNGYGFRSNAGVVQFKNSGGSWANIGSGTGSGSVTSVSVTTANGISGVVATPTTTPALTLSLGDITPTSVSVSGTTISGTGTGSFLSIAGTWNGSGVNLGALKVVITDTASGAASLAVSVLGGSAGSTNLFSVDKSGNIATGGNITIPNTVFLKALSSGGAAQSVLGINSSNQVLLDSSGNGVTFGSFARLSQWQSLTSSGLLTITNQGASTGVGVNVGTDMTIQFTSRAGADTAALKVNKAQFSGAMTTLALSTGYVAKTTTYAILTTDYTVDCTSGTFTVTLPTAVGVSGQQYVIKNSGSGVITIATTSAQTIDGASTVSLSTQYASVMVQSNGANWIVM